MAHSYQPHFFQPLLHGFGGLNIPIAFFSRHIHGNTTGNTTGNTWTLRSDATDNTWEVLQEERRLTRGWKEFTEAHDLRVGDIVIFKLEDEMVFHVSPFGPSCCDIQYTTPQVQEEAGAEEQQSNISSNVCFKREQALIMSQRHAYSWDYGFVFEVAETNVQEYKLALPVEATGCKALNKQCKEATLVNIDGKLWTVALRFSESGGFYYIKWWRKFCHDNKCRIGDLFAINVVGDGMSSPLLCVYAPTKEILEILSTWKRNLNFGDIASSRMHRRLV
ncbi:hypothetical protein Bca52824_012166 [Brassica carinata]|uniref:TF-B3 domain-containing protein n=1 Tax=Brassica carinata TaxID=52824 RepID=A0A8X8B247_BRACI|nr:hypothetical protein Bca52824_012166 [Brassica carinata]